MILFNKIPGVFDKLLSATSTIVTALIGGAWIFVIVGVCLRLSSSTISSAWFTEIVEYCLLWMTFLGATWLLKIEGHVRMDMILTRLKPKSQAIVNTFTSVIGSLLCLVITCFGILKMLDLSASGSRMTNSLFGPPAYIIYMVIPIGMFLLSIEFGRKVYQSLKLLIKR